MAINIDLRWLADRWADTSWIERILFGTLAVLIVLLIISGIGMALYMDEHHCRRTGQSRLSSLQKIGDSYYPSSSYEYRCDGGEIIWVP